MTLRFTKMHGLGNDFVVIDAIRQDVALSGADVRRIADRRFGVGCDQVLLAAPATQPGMDFRYRIFNADGGEVEQCGNGVRCLARFLLEEGLTTRDRLTIETLGGPTEIAIEADGQVTVNMGPPRLEPTEIPFTASPRATTYELDVNGETLTIGAVSMGNPHAVTVVPDVDTAPVDRLGPVVERHGAFPARVNAGFMQVVDPEHVRLRVYERGAGETLACGTGACAAVVAGRLRGLLAETVAVDLPGGRLAIRWAGEGEPVWMTGPATTVFQGRIPLSPDDDAPGQVR
ncbi:diaminopimelate epimerase [Aquisalimonas asiatica]|uniref:Diaminopimelate epimerase n=1 Tax=Aquisalimonas asiatica TaxID=406100 RepID=A0A1H8UF04_9GAMM|nr:diaminopimelate epimerase [Aquisalimonas asiatica]SEP01208.1 diaminopimelate epimerase [Aquisalimonas asiatica]